LSLEKVIKFVVTIFVISIVSRSIEEISFIYYIVPVMCFSFIILLFISSKFNRSKNRDGDTSAMLSVTEYSKQHSHHPSTIFHKSFFLFSAKGGFRFTQYLPSSIFHYTSYFFLLPGLWFLLTSFWSSYPEISAVRALYFILISSGSIAAGILWTQFSPKNILGFLLPSNVIIILLCTFSLLTNIPSDSWTGGHGKGFMGFFGHQNLLASVILFTIPSVIDLRTRVKSPKSKVFFYLLITSNLIFLIITYSRASIVSLLFGVIIFLILNRNWRILFYSSIVAVLVFIAILFTPSLNQFADKIIKKDFPEVYSSRIWMWEPSYRAAQNGGLTGLGYGMSDPNIKPGSLGDHYEGERFVREKGNSVLALVEETGVVGLVLFLLPIIYLLRKLPDTRYQTLPTGRQVPDYKNLSGIRHPASGIQKLATSIPIASLAALILHAQFEAWWVGVGSVQLPLFYVYIGFFTGYLQLRLK